MHRVGDAGIGGGDPRSANGQVESPSIALNGQTGLFQGAGVREDQTDFVLDLRDARSSRPVTGLSEFPCGLLVATWWQRSLKRTMDIVGSMLVILLLSPIFIVTAASVVLSSQGPVFFRQTRIGRRGAKFSMWKFRSMLNGAHEQRADLADANEQPGPVFKIRSDPRVTRVGRVLRKYSIDELPQLFHVLMGKMSLVGPRPPLPEEVAVYSAREMQRLLIKPGLTCIWQTNGRSEVAFDRWIEMDLEYIEEFTLLLDIKLLLKTIPAVMAGRGAY